MLFETGRSQPASPSSPTVFSSGSMFNSIHQHSKGEVPYSSTQNIDYPNSQIFNCSFHRILQISSKLRVLVQHWTIDYIVLPPAKITGKRRRNQCNMRGLP